MKRNGLRWYQVIYRLLYRVGLVFWQRSAPPSEFAHSCVRTLRDAGLSDLMKREKANFKLA